MSPSLNKTPNKTISSSKNPEGSVNSGSFASLDLSQAMLESIKTLGYERMTPVQEQSIPHLLKGRDLVGQSKTGSGKTAAFAIPLIEKVNLKLNSPQGLILCPTRELGAQIVREIRRLGKNAQGLRTLPVTGGESIRPQILSLERGVHIVIGTPGRVIDHLERGTLKLEHVRTLILDEADRMLDMGFQEDMEKIISKISKDRQTILFSATYPREIMKLSEQYQNDPLQVTVEDSEKSHQYISETYVFVEREEKIETLLNLLEKTPVQSALVFCNLKASVADVARSLKRAGVSAEAISGDLEQNDRTRVLAKFRNQSLSVLIATDVAARGIDITDLDLVVNFDFPGDPEVYVHRIGRTGRAEKSGRAISFFEPKEKFKLSKLKKSRDGSLEEEPPCLGTDLDSLKSKRFAPAPMATLYISAGRKHKIRPTDILGALTGAAGGLSADNVGKIEIHDFFTYVAVSHYVVQEVLGRLRNGQIKGKRFQVELVK